MSGTVPSFTLPFPFTPAMPGQQLQTAVFILAKQPSGSDKFDQLTAFSAEHGVLHCLTRLSQGKAAANRTTTSPPSTGPSSSPPAQAR